MPQLRQIILPIIVISVIITFLQPNVNESSHIGGLVTGFVIGMFFFKPKPTVVWRNRHKTKKIPKKLFLGSFFILEC